MSIHLRPHLNPAVEAILLLERTYAREQDIPTSIADACQHYAGQYSIPLEQLETLTAPLRPLEAELLARLQPREDLWGSMFYPTSHQENLLAWGFFFLEQEGPLQNPDLPLLQRLTALMLNSALEPLLEVHTLSELMQFLEPFPCSSRTKWICAQVWQQPTQFFDHYRQLVELAAPVVAQYDPELQPLTEAALGQVTQALETGPEALWHQLGLPATPLESLIVSPMAGNFNGIGITWDHTLPNAQAHLMIGLLRYPLQELIRRYSDNSEFLADRLKSLSDQRRIEILKALKESPRYGQELADLMHLSPATISHHMSVLVSSGFVSVDRQGAKTSYTLNRPNLDSFLNNLRTTLL